MSGIEPEKVRAHLDKISGSTLFAESDRLRRFLRFTVESKLQNQQDRVKEYILGREVFDRTDGYDPRLDPIVRVEARRLRSKLAEYYNGPGRDEAIRLEYPKGTYLPEIRHVKDRASVSPRPAPIVSIVAAIVVLAIVIFAYRSEAGRANGMIAVLPAQWLWNDRGQYDSSAISLSEAITSDLANGNVARVVAWPVVAQQHDNRKPLREAAANLGASKVISVNVRDVGHHKLVTVFLIDPASGQKLRADQYLTDGVSSVGNDPLAQRITDDLAKAKVF